MIIKNKLIEINEGDIFANDELDRKDTIEDLSKLIVSNNEPFVFSINASWGSGKTTFIKLWKTYLKKECEVNSIYFSAWEDDFSKEPLISILGEFNSYIEENFKDGTPIKNNFNKAKEFGGKVLRRGVPALIKGATGGFLDADAGFEAAASAMTEQTAKALIDNYSTDKNVLIEFKKAIETVLNEMDSEKPFVIFIDELDRCRPLYAIELLERIKHVFGIKNLIFILSIDKINLAESIKSQYGNIDTDNYLRRFIDLEYNLSNPSIDKFCDVLYKKFNLEEIIKSKDVQAFRDVGSFHHVSILKKLAIVYNLSLRQIEQIFTRLHIIFSTIELGLSQSYFRVFIFFEMLKSYDSDLYYSFIHNGNKSEEIKNLLISKFIDDNIYRDVSLIIETTIDATSKTDEDFIHLISIKNDELKRIQDTNSFEYRRLSRYIDVLQADLSGWGDFKLNNLIDKVINKIEFVDRFNLEKNE